MGRWFRSFFTVGEVTENHEASSAASSKPSLLAERLGEKVAGENLNKSAET